MTTLSHFPTTQPLELTAAPGSAFSDRQTQGLWVWAPAPGFRGLRGTEVLPKVSWVSRIGGELEDSGAGWGGGTVASWTPGAGPGCPHPGSRLWHPAPGKAGGGGAGL